MKNSDCFKEREGETRNSVKTFDLEKRSPNRLLKLTTTFSPIEEFDKNKQNIFKFKVSLFNEYCSDSELQNLFTVL